MRSTAASSRPTEGDLALEEARRATSRRQVRAAQIETLIRRMEGHTRETGPSPSTATRST